MEFRELARLNGGYVESRILHAAVTLELFDALDASGRTAEEITVALGTNLRATTLLLNALVAMRLVRKRGEHFLETDASRAFLTAASPTSYTAMVRFDAALWPVWERLAETVRSGEPARAPDMFQRTPEETALFVDAMASLVQARGDARVLADTLDLTNTRCLLDVGSGPGMYPVEFCRRHPHLRISIFDLPGTLEVTRRHLAETGLDDRISLVAGDYRRDALPGGFDVVFLSNIIHGEDEDTNRELMRKVYAALAPGGRVLIKDHVTDDSGTSPAAAAIFSIAMLLFARGRDYAYGEIRAWLLAAGFARVGVDVLPPGLISTLVTGYK
ncbi:MAG: methyltransferase domain-containing protein [Deltaproteobacteria bacterium]|nr:methyltransferase domain-containing protein [Deltaproteobacteria bacterium]